MHISEGVLSAPVLACGALVAAGGIAVGLKRTREEDIPRVALLSSAFFVASFVHVPIGPSSVHLILNGINGLILGWAAFPSIFVALLLQAVMFQYGGITVIGVNTMMMALPAVLCRYVFYRLVTGKNERKAYIGAFLCGASSVAFSGILVAGFLFFTDESFFNTAALVLAAHLPVMIIEGVITAVCIGFIRKVKPSLLGVVDD
ncbi:MAG TPA: cobalt transporter CbiM [bacterium]|nr:cobalt transporter CbiM [bacterium]